MTESEKAKAYDEAVEKAKRLYEQGTITESLASIFPELRGDEDERIRKCLIGFFEDWHENRSHCWGIAVTDILAWLEKQGEQKPAAWSEEDEENLQHCCMAISVDSLHTYEDKQEMEAWLKSLKDRVQPKQVCGVEDEKHILSIEQVLNCADLLNVVPEKINVLKDWLKSLKDRIVG